MTRIDLHAHVTPPQYLEGLRGPDGNLPPLPPATVDGLEATMARHDIDAAVISPGPPGVFFGDQGRANDLARLVNEELAAVATAQPARFAALATLPLPDAAAAVSELTYALDELGMDGVWLPSHVAGTYLGDPVWDMLFDELNRRAAYVFVHPALPPYSPPAPHPVWLYEFPFETTRALTNVLYSGTLERCPEIRFQWAHLGGTAPYLAHRLASLADREPEKAAAAPAGALAYLRRQFFDTGLSNHALPVKTVLEVAPVEQVVFGTDYPYAVLPDGDPSPEFDFLGDGRDKVDAGNAARLVPRLTEALSGAAR